VYTIYLTLLIHSFKNFQLAFFFHHFFAIANIIRREKKYFFLNSFSALFGLELVLQNEVTKKKKTNLECIACAQTFLF